MSKRNLRARLTYANVMSTVAVALALTGGATAIALSLPKNSVKSKQLAPGAVKTSDIGKDAVTGDKVKESTLGKVPAAVRADTAGRADTAAHADSAANADHAVNADHAGSADTAAVADSLGGTLSPTNVAKTVNVAGQFSTELEVKVPGFGRYWLRCKTSEGDKVAFNLSSSSKQKVIDTGVLVANEFPLDTPDIFPIDDTPEGASSEYGTQGKRLYVHLDVAVLGSTKTLELDGGGFDNGSGTCVGQLHATISG